MLRLREIVAAAEAPGPLPWRDVAYPREPLGLPASPRLSWGGGETQRGRAGPQACLATPVTDSPRSQEACSPRPSPLSARPGKMTQVSPGPAYTTETEGKGEREIDSERERSWLGAVLAVIVGFALFIEEKVDIQEEDER